MEREAIGQTLCPDCGGNGHKRNGTPCPNCEGTGLVAAYAAPKDERVPED